MFVDQARIYVKAGDGGNGCVAFRREKFVPRGGPSGGNGGRGGNVFVQSSSQLNTLLSFKYRQHFVAGRGGHGSGKNRYGRDGDDLVIEVPVGTVLTNAESKEQVFDFKEPDQRQLIARGGRGGRGNAAFKSSTRQAPRECEAGEAGEELTLLLELKVLADVGLVGYPNAGKSTLISVISKAHPKIADYPFTTLTPNLGVVSYDDFDTVVVADIPGLIEGAHQGTGLGDRFLRHVERCRLLLHLIDVSGLGPEDPVQAMLAISRELSLYDRELGEKPRIVVASKMDAADPERLARLVDYCQDQELELLQIAAVTGEGIEKLKEVMRGRLS